jgi:hypothetical protein
MFSQCPACGSADTQPFFEASSVPVFCNVLWDEAELARSATRGRILLHACNECRLVFNAAFDPRLLEYSPRYENSLHGSPLFQRFAEDLARHLVERFGLRDEVVLEVGCGRGEFLALLCGMGPNRGIGFDQSYDPEGEQPNPGTGTLEIKQAPFPASAEGLEPALTFCRHVLEHISEPREFVGAMVDVAARRHGGGVYVEVPNVLYTLRDLGIWDIIYEHVAYYSAPALARLLGEAGVTVDAAYPAYGDQFLCAEGVMKGRGGSEISPVEDWNALISAFSGHQHDKVAEWEDRLGTRLSRGERVALWGAGSKGVTFLNMVAGTEAISHVIDVNPRKHGRYTAGTGHEILPPEGLVGDPPAAVLVMNPLYVEEIRSTLSGLGLDPTIELV